MTTGVLEPLSGPISPCADSTEDIRGLRVFDRSGSEFGKIDDVFIRPAERRARFVAVKSGDILGIGGRAICCRSTCSPSAATTCRSTRRPSGSPRVRSGTVAT
jgi:hypothetical protein